VKPLMSFLRSDRCGDTDACTNHKILVFYSVLSLQLNRMCCLCNACLSRQHIIADCPSYVISNAHFAFGAPVKCHVITVKFYAEFEPTCTPLVFLSYMIFICFLPYHMRRAKLDQEDTILCKTSVV